MYECNIVLLAVNHVPELAILVDTTTVRAIFWNAYGAWIEYGYLRMIVALFIKLSMRMAINKCIKAGHLWPFINAVVNTRSKHVTMREENGELLACLRVLIKQNVVISHARKIKD